jgi:hypothetical protein
MALAVAVITWLRWWPAVLHGRPRVSGGIILPKAAHAVWDFAVYSGYLGPDPGSSSTASQVLFLLSLGLVIVLAVTHRWWRITSTNAPPAPS